MSIMAVGVMCSAMASMHADSFCESICLCLSSTQSRQLA